MQAVAAAAAADGEDAHGDDGTMAEEASTHDDGDDFSSSLSLPDPSPPINCCGCVR